MSHPIQLIVGLGNPGNEYQHTRHNAGAWYVINLAKQIGANWRLESKFFCHYTDITLNHHNCRLILPSTYMNHSGQAVQAISNFYKIPHDAILIAHDELDLAAGLVRLKQGGGHAGHNGLRDIINRTGSANFLRLRIGISRPPIPQQPVADYVLAKPTTLELNAIESAVAQAIDITPLLVSGQISKAMQVLHTNPI